MPAVTTPMRLVSATYLGVLVVNDREAKPAATMAAVPESALTTRWRDEPNRANSRTGKNSVERPVITGVPMILV